MSRQEKSRSHTWKAVRSSITIAALFLSAGAAIAQPSRLVPGPMREAHPDPASPGKTIVFGNGKDSRIAGPNHPPIDTIPPMPMPDERAPIPGGPFGDISMMEHDAETKTTRTLPVGAASGLDRAQGGGSFAGALHRVNTGIEMQRGFGTMTAATDLDTWPRSGNVKLVMHFIDVNGNDRWFNGSGSMNDAGVVLTAAHCVYARSPNGITINDWAEQVYVYPAWDGVGDQNSPGPLSDDVIQNFGWCRGTQYMAGSGYVNDGDWDRDCGLIRLNRNSTRSIGMLTGWFGWAWGGCETNRTFYNFSYPAESCGGSLHTGRTMYYWNGQFDSCPLFTNQLRLNTGGNCLDTVWGGMSGSGAYYIDGSNRFVNAVCSTSNRDDRGNYCKLWEQFVNDMQTFESDTRGNTFDLEALRFRVAGSTTVRAGENLPQSSVIISNATDANPGSRTYTLRVYLSGNNNISTSDTLLATYNYASVNFADMDNITFNIPAVEIPVGTSPGTYWVGVILDDATDSNTSNNDTDTWDAQQITVNPCLLPSAPTNFIASDGTSCTNITLTWNAVSGATNYRIFRNTVNNSGTATFIANDNASPYNDPAPIAGQGYYYWIRATDGCGESGFSAAAYGYRDTAPGTPTGLSATDGTVCGSINVGWNAVTGATSYDLYRNTSNNSGTSSIIANNTAATFHIDNTAALGQTYYYWVRANNSCGQSGFSTVNSGYRDSVPPAPTNLNASDHTNCTGVTVAYTAVADATSYDIYRNTVNNSATAVQIGNVAPGFLYLDNTAVAGTSYFYWARARNSCGASGFSGSDQGTRAAALGGVAGINATDGTACNSVQVTWTPLAGATSYDVYRSTINISATAVLLANVPSGPYVDSSVVGTNIYYYWVRARNGCGAGPFAGSNSGYAGDRPVIVEPPANRIVPVGASVSFNVSSPGMNTYAWRHNGAILFNGGAISGAGTATLTINPVEIAHAGIYDCIVMNTCGTTLSGRARLEIRCPADFDDGSGTGTPDGGVTIEDLLYYLGLFDIGDVAADIDDGSATGTQDGGVTIEDLLYYLTRFDAGC